MKPRFTIAHRGLKEGAHAFEWRVDGSFWTERLESGIIRGEVEVSATLEKSATGVMRLDVAINGSVTVPCDRCLEDCDLPVSWRGKLAVKVSDQEQSSDGEVLWLMPAEALIDLEQYIYESVILSLPMQRVHPEDVHGQPLCNPAMLKRFKIVSEEDFENYNL
jgi:uncharacterized metal-binding protein YceD (DUF177 family)